MSRALLAASASACRGSGYTDGTCSYCRAGRENLCDHPRFTGYQIDGGYAQYTVADARYVFPIPEGYSDAEAAPLLCAGLIGYRSLKMTGDPVRNRASASTVSARRPISWRRSRAIRGARSMPSRGPATRRRKSSRAQLGAVWVGGSDEMPPEPLDAAIIFAPVGALVPAALKAVRKGGVVVCGGIHMSDIPSFPYEILWEERVVRSVANLTRDDAREFLALAPKVPVKTTVVPMTLATGQRGAQTPARGRADRRRGADPLGLGEALANLALHVLRQFGPGIS